jgi:hypothetical protein
MNCRISTTQPTATKPAVAAPPSTEPIGGGTLNAVALKKPIPDAGGCGGFGQDTFARSGSGGLGGALAAAMSPAVLAQAGGAILSNNGANVISDKGGSLLSNNGASLTGGGGGAGPAPMVIIQGPAPQANAASGNPIMDFWKNLIAPIRDSVQQIVNWVQQVIDATKPAT